VEFVGMPEGFIPLAETAVYLALAPKSNALYTGFKAAQHEVQLGHNPPVPVHLRNAPTRTMKDLGFGRDYVYAHDTEAGIAAMSCLPEPLAGREFYRPRGKGWERELRERMERIAAWHRRRATPQDPESERPTPPTGGTT
jgi:putative ATPase